MNRKAMIAMSGGVDSSVAAYLMKERGCQCLGATMKLFANEDAGLSRESTCCSLDDVADARSVAGRLKMPYYVFNFSADFDWHVMRPFVETYLAGNTPNPCIDCNRRLKFEKLLLRARQLDYSLIVTGHYARISRAADGKLQLKKAADASKDQSYVLYFLNQEALRHTAFPLGEMTKSQVRKIALAQGFVNARKKESQDICFVPEGKYADFIERYTGAPYPAGDFIDLDGKFLARHAGQIRYTIGQRKGLGIAAGHPVYVCRKDARLNTVTVGEESDLYSKVLLAEDFNWISGETPHKSLRVQARTRYRQPEHAATAEVVAENTVRVRFDQPQRAITTGQAVVLYDGDLVLGGGVITKVP